MYFAIVTMITLGYGDIYAITTVEKIFLIFVTLLSCAVFAYCLNTSKNIIFYYIFIKFKIL